MRTQRAINRKIKPYFETQFHYIMCCFSISNLVDTDECSTLSPCHANATCNNTEGSYTCSCDNGFSGDGILCNGKRFHWFDVLTILKKLINNLSQIIRVVIH